MAQQAGVAENDEVFLGKIARPQGFPRGQGMIDRQNAHRLGLGQRLDAGAWLFAGHECQADVELLACHQFDHIDRTVRMQDDRNAVSLRREGIDQSGQVAQRQTRHRGDPQAAFAQPSNRRRRLADPLAADEKPLDILIQRPSLIGRRDPCAVALEQMQFQVLFEIANQAGYGGLRNVQHFARTGHTAGQNYGTKGFQLAGTDRIGHKISSFDSSIIIPTHTIIILCDLTLC